MSEASKDHADALGLSPDQLEALKHLRTFRVTTSDVLRRLGIGGGSAEGVKSFLQRLRARGLIASADLFGTTDYHFLTNKGLALFGDPVRRTLGLHSSALAEAYGILLFCIQGEGRKKLRKDQFQTQFPELAVRGMRATNYYLDDEEKPRRIGFLYVDRGIDTSKVARRVGTVAISKRLGHPKWRTSVLDAHRFAVGIATPSPQKVETLRTRLERDWPNVAFRFEVVPELLLIRDRRRHAPK